MILEKTTAKLRLTVPPNAENGSLYLTGDRTP
jgi:hypothetical protein